MTICRPEVAQRAHTLLQTLLAAALAAITILITACSEQQPQPTPQTTDERPMQTIEAMAQEIAVLQTKAAVPTETAQTEKLEHTALPAPTMTPKTPQPTPPLAKVATPAFSGTGICSRSPEIQNEILNTLDVELCQVVNAHELFRITKLHSITASSIKEGDFHGLVNVESLQLYVGSVGANGLTGLERLKYLHVGINNKSGLQGESFSGLENLEELEITLQGANLPQLPEMPNLQHLSVLGMRIDTSEEKTYTPFKNLPNLETLKLRIFLGEETDETRTEPHRIPSTLLKGTGNLREVTIETYVAAQRPRGPNSRGHILGESLARMGRDHIPKNIHREAHVQPPAQPKGAARPEQNLVGPHQ